MKLPLLLTALAALCLTGCQSQTAPLPQEPATNMGTSHVPPAPGIATTPESFVGTWQKNNLVRVLRSDGTGEQTGGDLGTLKFRWKLNGTDQMRMDFEGAAAAASGTNKVTLSSDGQSWSTEVAGLISVWKRKK